MIVPDLNLLIYAIDQSFPQHFRARTWWLNCLNGAEPVGLCDVVSFGFVRLTTRKGVYARPLPVATAVDLVDDWLALPHIESLSLCQRSRARALNWIRELGVAGNLSTDLQIAALADRHGATIHTNDTDFLRIPGVAVHNPLTAA